ncbi:hypothetical protein JMJ35_004973 [Cladonia borealis]|uniref:Nephrocystin 3-like N-terminal domain-containing protein n=1 Tax=Cladonia borealis TaxID=184061 RepID=A0AA39R2S7_9LECA|nr:hypothetical protein JMJ35_004973 [Cladonia borealis]
MGFNEWQNPLRRLEGYAKDLKKIVERQDTNIGIFHELAFRTRWPAAWREVQALLAKIEREKNKLHLAVAMDGVGLSRKVYMLVDERLPQNMHIQSQNKHCHVPNEINIVWRSLLPMPQDELAAIIRKQISEFTAWPDLSNDLDRQDHRHYVHQNLCGERTCEEFLNSSAYQGWKNRKTRGPSLLYVSGSVATGKSILCSQVIQDLRNSYGMETGLAYFYLSHSSYEDTELDGLETRGEGDDSHVRRVEEISAVTQTLLEQDFGNVSIAIFSRPERYLDPILDLADVSIRLLKAEPSPVNLHGYCRSRIERKVLPELVTAGFRQPEIWLGDIEDVICGASDGLYLAMDMFIDSTIDAIRDDIPIGDYLVYIRENSEIMMQRDPEIMKQKNFGPNVPNAEPSYSTVREED